MIPPRHILVATDFSSPAAHAIARATALAVAFRSGLTLAHVLPASAIDDLGSAVLDQLTSASFSTESLASQAHDRLTRLAMDIEERHGVRCEVRVEAGRPAQRVAAIAEQGADLLVVGASGAHGARRALTGTTSQKLLRLSPCPVLLIRRTPGAAYSRVLAPVDFSPSSRAALDLIAGWLPAAQFHVAHAFELPHEGLMRFASVNEEVIRHYTEKQSTALWHQLREWVRGVEERVPEVHLHVEHGYPNTVIERLTDELGVDLVALAAHGKSELERTFLGSISLHTALLSHSDVLVLTGRHFDERVAQLDAGAAPALAAD